MQDGAADRELQCSSFPERSSQESVGLKPLEQEFDMTGKSSGSEHQGQKSGGSQHSQGGRSDESRTAGKSGSSRDESDSSRRGGSSSEDSKSNHSSTKR
jgi:hypothetical protein